MTRKLNSWITSFLDHTQALGTPKIWRRWTALCIISGALERRVWINTAKGVLYPNIWALLVGPPAVGKSISIEEAFDFWKQMGKLYVAPSRITRAGFIDRLAKSTRTMTHAGALYQYHSLLIPSVEFGNLVPAYDNEWLNVLNEIYDCRPQIEEQTRQHGTTTIDMPHVVLLAGTQPQYLASLLPETAFGMGFTSRLIMIYSATEEYVPIFTKAKRNGKAHEMLLSDLKEIVGIQGEMTFAADAAAHLEQQYIKKFPPVPDHPKLTHYNGRRLVHIMKLAMVLSAARSNTLHITMEDVQEAIKTLLEAETQMPQVFTEMSSKGYADANDECYQYIMREWAQGKRKPVSLSKVTAFLARRVPSQHINATIEIMVKSGELRREMLKVGSVTIEAFTPLMK